jgi:hypothetical protein
MMMLRSGGLSSMPVPVGLKGEGKTAVVPPGSTWLREAQNLRQPVQAKVTDPSREGRFLTLFRQIKPLNRVARSIIVQGTICRNRTENVNRRLQRRRTRNEMDAPSLTFVVFALPAALLFHAAANSHYRKLSLSAADFLFGYVAALREDVTNVGSNP